MIDLFASVLRPFKPHKRYFPIKRQYHFLTVMEKAFVDVVGIDRRIECVVDPSIDTNTPLARETRTSEAPTDKVLLSGAALLAQELGAKVIEK